MLGVKNILKLLFIFFVFLMSLCSGVQSAEVSNAYLSKTSAGVELSVKLHEAETSIVAANNQSCEISSLNDKKDIFINGSLDKACAQNKFLQQIFTSKYNQLYSCSSHNISSYLKNEICIRAP